MNINNLGYELDLDKVSSILRQWNMVHQTQVAWYLDEERNDLMIQEPIPTELQELINHAIKSEEDCTSEQEKRVQEWIKKYKGARKAELRSRLKSLKDKGFLTGDRAAERDAIIALLC
jgi:hypothetical protein